MENEQKICQCCGMPLNDALFSREPDGTVNTDYCRYCYADGKFRYTDISELIEFCVEHFSDKNCTSAQMRSNMRVKLSRLKYWKNRQPE